MIKIVKSSIILLILTIQFVCVFFVIDFVSMATIGSESIQIEQSLAKEVHQGYTEYTPTVPSNKRGIIVYTGAKVDKVGYTYIIKHYIERGYTVFMSDFLFEYAFFNSNLADQIISENQDITTFALGGHSLGGAMIGSYLSTHHAPQIEHVFLLGAYTTFPMTSVNTKVISIAGELDGNSTAEKIEANAKNLPNGTVFTEIKGGNHRYFADYTYQKGDNEATITMNEQHQMILQALDQFIEQ